MTEITLKEHLDTKIAALDRLFASQLTAIAEALKLATSALDGKLQSMNEFRDALRDQAGRLATKEELGLMRELIDTRLKVLEKSWAYAAGVGAVMGAVAAALAVKVLG